MFAEELLLCIMALRELVNVELMLQRVRFLGGEHAHEFEFETDVILALTSILGHIKSERPVEGGEIGEAMRLEERIGFDVAVFDFIQRARATRGVTEGGEISVVERVEGGG
jgi:hypothetical protein